VDYSHPHKIPVVPPPHPSFGVCQSPSTIHSQRLFFPRNQLDYTWTDLLAVRERDIYIYKKFGLNICVVAFSRILLVRGVCLPFFFFVRARPCLILFGRFVEVSFTMVFVLGGGFGLGGWVVGGWVNGFWWVGLGWGGGMDRGLEGWRDGKGGVKGRERRGRRHRRVDI